MLKNDVDLIELYNFDIEFAFIGLHIQKLSNFLGTTIYRGRHLKTSTSINRFREATDLRAGQPLLIAIFKDGTLKGRISKN